MHDPEEKQATIMENEDGMGEISDFENMALIYSPKVCDIEEYEVDAGFDPFNLDEEKLYHHIFQYLSGKDIINLSQTSKFFYEFTGESKVAMDKIKFVVSEKHGREVLSQQVVECSQRHYRHLDIKGIFDSTAILAAFIEKNSQSLISIITSYDFKTGHVKTLEKLTFVPKCLDSPINLVFHGLTTCTINLRELVIYGKVNAPCHLLRCMQMNAGLKKLVFEIWSADEAYFKAGHQFDFKLETLHCNASQKNSDVFWANFIGFLEYHADSLRELKINCNYRLLNRMLTILPKLRCLTFSPLPSAMFAGSVSDFNFMGHRSIQEARFIFTSPEIISRFVQYTPNLRTIYIADLSVETFKILVEFAPNLHCLKYAYFDVNHTNLAGGTSDEIRKQFIEYYEKFSSQNRRSRRHAFIMIQI